MCNKDFHPSNIRNQRKVGLSLLVCALRVSCSYISSASHDAYIHILKMYEAEQRQKQEERRQEELRQQYLKEQELYKSK